MYNIIVKEIKTKFNKEEFIMKKLYNIETTNKVLRGEYWDIVRNKAMLAKCRMCTDYQTFYWMVMFAKTNGALHPSLLSAGVRDQTTGNINGELFKYIPWYLGYIGTDFTKITSAPYVSYRSDEPLDMIAAQFTLEVEKYNKKHYEKQDNSYLDLIEGKLKKEPDDPLLQLLAAGAKRKAANSEPSSYLDNGLPQEFQSLSDQLYWPCSAIHLEVKDTLKAYGYNNPVFQNKVRYFGQNNVAIQMLTTLFVMYIIKNYFATRNPHSVQNRKLTINSGKNRKLVRDEITRALTFEDKISDFWRSVKQNSPFTPWEKQNYNTIQNTKEILDRAPTINLLPKDVDYINDEYNDLEHFPEMSLF